MTVSCFICYDVFDIMLSFLFDFLFAVFFTTVKTLPWTARSKECYWLVGVFENRVVTKNTCKAPKSCLRRTDSLEWRKVEKARKNRGGGLGREPPSLSILYPLPPCFFFFFCADLYFAPFPNIWTSGNSKKSPSAPLPSCHFQWSTQVTYWNWLHVSVTGVLLSAYSTVACSTALPLVCFGAFFLFFWLVNLLLELGLATFCLPAFHFSNKSFLSLYSSRCPKREFLQVKRFSLLIWRLRALLTRKKNYSAVFFSWKSLATDWAR